MALTTSVKDRINLLLRGANLRIDSLTAENLERQRLRGLAEAGHFDRPVFPTPPPFARMNSEPIFAAIKSYSSRFNDFEEPRTNNVGYSFDNPFFSSPDAETLYSVIRHLHPGTIVEVGCGNSTKISRQAILDGGLPTRLICVDPFPRASVQTLADDVFAEPVENLVGSDVFQRLGSGDVLFIDSSHTLRAGNDAVALYLRVLPELRAGVVIHIHDVFLPYDYPKQWALDENRDWNEQYLVHSLLMFGDAFDVLWAGHYLQRTRPDFCRLLPRACGKNATSLWLRKRI